VRGWASKARRYARRRLPFEWATGPLQSNAWALALKAGFAKCAKSAKKAGGMACKRPVSAKAARPNFCTLRAACLLHEATIKPSRQA
jgi:hypothetical protein